MIRKFFRTVLWSVAAFGAAVFALLILDLLQPAPWTGWAVIASVPALFAACIMRINDGLRNQGFAERHIPTAKANLARSMAFSFAVGLLVAGVGIFVVYWLVLYQR